jgi:hypothetical protein
MDPAKHDTRCQFTNSEGRRCRTDRSSDHPSLCSYHLHRQPREATSPEDLAPELLGPLEDFRSAAAVNYALGKLLLLQASNRIAPRNAAVLAYTCQLLLQSISDVRREISWSYNSDQADRKVRNDLDATSSLLEIPNPARRRA